MGKCYENSSSTRFLYDGIPFQPRQEHKPKEPIKHIRNIIFAGNYQQPLVLSAYQVTYSTINYLL